MKTSSLVSSLGKSMQEAVIDRYGKCNMKNRLEGKKDVLYFRHTEFEIPVDF